MRCVLAAITVTGLCAAGADAAMVRFLIRGADGEPKSQIGPDGGRVPYQILVATDPEGTPGNFGLASFSFTLTTNTGVPQLPVTAFGPDFENWLIFAHGEPLNDDLVGIWATQISPRPGPNIPFPGVGQSGFVPFATGELVIPPSPVGTNFIIGGTGTFGPVPSVAWVYINEDAHVDVAPIVGVVLKVLVVPEPASYLLLTLGCGALLRHRRNVRT